MPWPPWPDTQRQYHRGIQSHPLVAAVVLVDVVVGMMVQFEVQTGELGCEEIVDVVGWREGVGKASVADVREAVQQHTEASLDPEAPRQTSVMDAAVDGVVPKPAVVAMDIRKVPVWRLVGSRWMADDALGLAAEPAAFRERAIAPLAVAAAYVVGSSAAPALLAAGASYLVPGPGSACLLKSFEEIARAEKLRGSHQVAQSAVERREFRAVWNKTHPILSDGSYAVIPKPC